jgi:ribosomal protein L20
MAGLKKLGIDLDRRSLSELAIQNAESFATILARVRDGTTAEETSQASF